MLYLYFRKNIPKRYDTALVKHPASAIKDERLFRLSWAVLAVLLIGYFVSELLSIPVSFVAGSIAVIFSFWRGEAPPSLRNKSSRTPRGPSCFFCRHVCCRVRLAECRTDGSSSQLIQKAADHGLFAGTLGMGFIAAILSSVMNNLPTVMIDAIAISGTDTHGLMREALIYANVIGSDLGPKITPIGSLATLLWLHVLSRKNVKISWGMYFKTGLILTIPTLFITLIGLYLWLLWLA